jgi:DNA replication factor GINS
MTSIADQKQVHSIGLGLEEVKVTFNHDLKINVSGVDIEAKQGQILNVPRWIAEVLESEKHIEVDEQDMVVELKQAIVKENVQGEFELSTLEPHFYIRLRSYMNKLSQQDFDRVESMLISLVRKRQGKIIHLADSSKLTASISEKLTIEERSFYNIVTNSSNEFQKQILGDKK